MDQFQSQSLPRRVVLLFKLEDPDEDIVKAFLRYCRRSESEYEENKHFIHLDPERSGSVSLAHIVIDMNKDDVKDPDFSTLPHEIYKVKLDVKKDMYVSLS
jgi:hypothetical protein